MWRRSASRFGRRFFVGHGAGRRPRTGSRRDGRRDDGSGVTAAAAPVRDLCSGPHPGVGDAVEAFGRSRVRLVDPVRCAPWRAAGGGPSCGRCPERRPRADVRPVPRGGSGRRSRPPRSRLGSAGAGTSRRGGAAEETGTWGRGTERPGRRGGVRADRGMRQPAAQGSPAGASALRPPERSPPERRQRLDLHGRGGCCRSCSASHERTQFGAPGARGAPESRRARVWTPRRALAGAQASPVGCPGAVALSASFRITIPGRSAPGDSVASFRSV
jgi:hypothetical protein